MLRNYLKVALRTLGRKPGYTMLNVGGLAVAMAACLLIGLFIRHEVSYDGFHERADRLYRVAALQQYEGKTSQNGAAPLALAPALEELPEVQALVQVSVGRSALVQRGEKKFYEEHGGQATTNVFEAFDFALQQGDPQTALRRPYTVVLAPQTARRYFGAENPVGQVLTIDRKDYEVTGVLAPMPSNTRFRADYFTSQATMPLRYGSFWEGVDKWGLFVPTYVLLPKDHDPARLERKLPALAQTQGVEDARSSFDFVLQPLPEIYLHYPWGEGRYGDPATLYLLVTLAGLILLVACINYMNLATARAVRRAREVGVRKVVGARLRQLVQQFLSEAVLVSFAALPFALLLAALLAPAFSGLVGGALGVETLRTGPFLLAMTGIVLLVGVAAGSYPAFVLSGAPPSAVLRGGAMGAARRAFLRKGLVVGQFAIAVVLIVSAVTVYEQLGHMQQKKLGFAEENVVALRLRSQDRVVQYEAFSEALLARPEVEVVTAAGGLLGTGTWSEPFDPGRAGAEQERVDLHHLAVDHGFVETLGIGMVAGRSFSQQSPGAVDGRSFILNEVAVRTLGWDEPVGHVFNFRGAEGRVIGVVEDFNYASVRSSVEPLALRVPEQKGLLAWMYVRTRPDVGTEAALGALRQTWEDFFPDWPLEYTFLEDELDALYQREARLGRVFSYASGLAVLIACLGLFGLAAYAAEQRTKEVGIRKVLGASAASVVSLLSKEFAKLVGIAFVVAAPVVYYAMERWLEDFAYRIALSPWIFAAAGAAVLILALLTVGYHALRAARANPADALRYE